MSETFDAYRDRLLGYLGDADPIEVLQSTPGELERRLAQATSDEADGPALTRRPAPGKWSIAEIAAHLADAELTTGMRYRLMLASPGALMTAWDEDAWAERLGYAQQDTAQSAADFRALRESNLRLLLAVPRAQWAEAYGMHETRGRQTVEEMVRLMAGHDLNHLQQTDRILDGHRG